MRIRLVGLVAVMLTLSGCFGPAPTPAPRQGGTLFIALPSDPRSLNPLVADDPVSALAYTPLFPLLYSIGPDLSASPDLAAAPPAVTDSGKTLTVPLRTDAKWSDGTPITADDVVYTVTTERDPQLATGAHFAWAPLLSVARVDAHTVRFTLRRADAGFVANRLVIPIVPQHVLSKIAPAAMATAPYDSAPSVTGGPFGFASRSAGQSITLAASHTYYGGRPHVDRVVEVVSADQSMLPTQLATGRLSWAPSLTADAAAQTVITSGVTIYSYADTSFVAMQFNVRAGHVFSDPAVRRALASSIDHDSVAAQASGGGQAYPVWDYIDQNSWAEHAADEAHYAHDPAHARRLLQDAGWAVSAGTPASKGAQTLSGSLIYPVGDAERAAAAGLIAQQARGSGFQLNPAPESDADFGAALATGTFDAALVSIPTAPDPDPSSLLLTGGAANAGGYSNPTLDSLIAGELDATASQTATANQVRAPIFDKIERLVTADLPLYFLWAPRVFTAVNATVGGLGSLGPAQEADRSNQFLVDWYLTG